MGATDLTPYSPRLLLQWDEQEATTKHRAIDGTLVFADVSGFTRLSERFARTSGKAGAEEMGSVVDTLFDELLGVASNRGGEMLKYGGDAALLFFRGDDHAPRAAAGAHEMLQRLREVGRIETRAGPVRLRASIGMNTGTFDLFKVGRRHQELVIAGPATSMTARMESAADAGEVLLSPSTAAMLDPRCVGEPKAGGFLLRRKPPAPTVPFLRRTTAADPAKFVSGNLARHLAVEDRPDHRLATVSFIHMMDMDELLAGVGAGVVAEMLDDTITVVMEALDDLGVTLLMTDLADDGAKVMAAAGAPLAGEDEERRMLLALRRMIEADTPLPLRAGVNRGHVFCASVGPPYRRTYTTIGDVTNTAARLCHKAAPGEVLALKSVLDHARGRFVAVEQPAFMAKNKAEPLVPFRVDAFAGDGADDGADEATRFPLMGRHAELEHLISAARSAHAGTGSLVELVGEMGSGKTRLVDELLRSLEADVTQVVVHCEPYERSTPFHPVRRLLQRILGAEPLEDAVARVAPNLEPWFPLLAGVLDRTVPDTDETRALDSRYRLGRTAAVTVELLEALFPHPAVVVVEDTHWLDDASGAFLRQLERRVSATPWLICATRRPEPASFTPVRESDSVQLRLLTDDELGALVDAATADAPIPPHRRAALVGRAAGNPLYLTELLAAGAGASDDAMPSSIEALMAAQIDRLPPAERQLLRQASVLGSRFDIGLLALIAEQPALERTRPETLSRRFNFLVEPEGTRKLRFRHMLVRDVAYEMLPFRERRALHLRAAEAIESSLGEGANTRAGILSFHFSNARAYDRAWPYARVAADRAIEKYANVEAIALLERAVEAAKHARDVPAEDLADVWEKLADRTMFIGNTARSRGALRTARRLHPTPLQVARLSVKEARLADREGNHDAVARCVRRGIRALEGCDDPASASERAELLVLYAWFKHHQGHEQVARRWAMRALDDAQRGNNQRALAWTYMVLDGIDVALGATAEPVRTRQALQIWEDLGQLDHQAIVLNNLGSFAYYQGRWAEALDYYDRGRLANERVGSAIDAGYGRLNVAEILIDQGHVDRAERSLRDLATVWRSLDHAVGLAFVEFHLGRIAMFRADCASALEHLDAARAGFAGEQLFLYALDADARIAECRLRLGAVDDALAIVRDALQRDAAAGGTRVGVTLRRVLAYCHASRGELVESWSAMDESLALARARGATFDMALALEGFEILTQLGATGGDTVGEAERTLILAELGVVATPPPPLATVEPWRSTTS